MWQTYAYWLMGALSNDPRKLAYFAGFYKGIQSAGAAVVWRMDATGASFDALFGSSWGLCAAGMLCALPVIYLRVQDTGLSEESFVDGPVSEKQAQIEAEEKQRQSTSARELESAPAPGTA